MGEAGVVCETLRPRSGSLTFMTATPFAYGVAATVAVGAFDGVGPFVPTVSLLAAITPSGVMARLVEVALGDNLVAGITLPMMLDDPMTQTFPAAPAASPGLRG
jgi:uncharacterized protein (DUF2062 family)